MTNGKASSVYPLFTQVAAQDTNLDRDWDNLGPTWDRLWTNFGPTWGPPRIDRHRSLHIEISCDPTKDSPKQQTSVLSQQRTPVLSQRKTSEASEAAWRSCQGPRHKWTKSKECLWRWARHPLLRSRGAKVGITKYRFLQQLLRLALRGHTPDDLHRSLENPSEPLSASTVWGTLS